MRTAYNQLKLSIFLTSFFVFPFVSCEHKDFVMIIHIWLTYKSFLIGRMSMVLSQPICGSTYSLQTEEKVFYMNLQIPREVIFPYPQDITKPYA